MTLKRSNVMVHQGEGRLKTLMGSGHRILLVAAPFLVVGLLLNIMYPAVFSVGGPSTALLVVSVVALIPGLIGWIWSAALVLRHVPRGELITTGPFAVVKHPIYTSVALLVLPWVGFLLDSWLGVVVGLSVYVGARVFAPAEEATLAAAFGVRWRAYTESVLIPWL